MKIHRQDNTFVIEKNGMPYQVIAGMSEYQILMNEYKENPSSFEEEYPYIPSLEEVKSSKKQDINQAREQARLDEGAEYNNDLFDIDERSQANITAIVSMLLANNVPEQFVSIYRSKTNKDHSFNKAQMVELGTVIGDKVTEIYKKSWDLKSLVDNASTKEEVEKIKWNM